MMLKRTRFAHTLQIPSAQITISGSLTKALLTFFLGATPFFSYAQMLQLEYNGSNAAIATAVKEANIILNSPDFYSKISAIQRFDNTTQSGLQIADDIKNLRRTVEVEEYWNPFGANAKTVFVIKLNSAKLRRSHASITNTVIHETVHAVDWWTNNKWDYTHDSNNPEGQENTAPWVIGSIAETLVH